MSTESININIVSLFLDVQPILRKIISYRTGSHQTAQDLSQEIYFRVLAIANEFPSYDDARNYLIRIALNAATDHLRTERRRVKLLEGAIDLFENHQSQLDDDFYIEEQIAIIDNALNQLPEKCRMVLYLSRIEGLTHAEIASRLGVSQSLVEKYAIRALLHCRKYLQSSGSDIS